MPISEMQKRKHRNSGNRNSGNFPSSQTVSVKTGAFEALILCYFLFLDVRDGEERQQSEVMIRSHSTAVSK